MATLRYVVVDELHTFDGAQGTDLALLLRRLQARLKTPENHLICTGTSATLGGNTDNLSLDIDTSWHRSPLSPSRPSERLPRPRLLRQLPRRCPPSSWRSPN